MTKKEGKRSAAAASDRRSEAGLLRALADRERQLRDLTEQALGFLEELAETRRRVADRDQLAARIGELERLIASTQQRLRHASGFAPAASSAGDDAGRPSLEIVCWGAESLAGAEALAASCAGVGVHWVGSPRAARALVPGSPVQAIVHRDARTPAQCWNLGMLATRADLVLFLAPGVEVAGPSAIDSTVATADVGLLCPPVRRGERWERGCRETDGFFRLQPMAFEDAALADAQPVPFPAAESFVLRRAAFERIGAFDEGWLGPLALLDFTLRLRAANFELLGLPSAQLALRASADAVTGPDDERERMLLLAAHRPDRLGAALADAPVLWSLAPEELASFVTRLLARLPTDGSPQHERALLAQIVAGIVDRGVPARTWCDRVQSCRVELLRGLLAAAGTPVPDEVRAALSRAEEQRHEVPAAAFAALAADIDLVRRIHAATAQALHDTRSERQQIDVERHAQSARAERAEGARASVEQPRQQIEQWLKQAQQELKEVHAARQAELARLQAAEQARQQLERQLQDLQQAGERARQHAAAELAGEREAHAATRQRLAAEAQAHLQLQQRHAAEAQQQEQMLSSLRRELQQLEQKLVASEQCMHSLHAELAGLAQAAELPGPVEPQRLRERVATLRAESSELAETLRAAEAADAEELLEDIAGIRRRLRDAESVIAERERWIGLLLAEVQRRRLRPRRLLPHEEAFLRRLEGAR